MLRERERRGKKRKKSKCRKDGTSKEVDERRFYNAIVDFRRRKEKKRKKKRERKRQQTKKEKRKERERKGEGERKREQTTCLRRKSGIGGSTRMTIIS